MDFPWDNTAYPLSIRHLANLIRVRYYGSNNRIYLDVGSFANAANTANSNYNVSLNLKTVLYWVSLTWTAGIFYMLALIISQDWRALVCLVMDAREPFIGGII